VAIGVASTAAVGAYVLYIAGELVTAIEPWQPLSPFHQALAGGPLGAGLPAAYLWMPVVATAFIAIALPIFDRRDIAAH
jgi:ABC-2 type transport system permease protein